VPHLSDYHHVTAVEALKAVWIDILLLALYAVLFFAGAFASFLRYDVR
jgi:ABC-type transport system involved in multi-copper enzyme maturation permease subunit